jgi:hypothetical protein
MLNIIGTNITLTRGDSANLTVEIKDSDGTQIPLVTGDTIYFTVKSSPSTTTKLLQKVITAFTGGLANIEILPADTSQMMFGKYYYDIQYSRADGYVRTIVAPSNFTVAPEVTYE